MMRRMVFGARAMSMTPSWMRRSFTDAKTIRRPFPYEQFAYSGNVEYVESIFNQWKTAPHSVDSSWLPIFQQLESASPDVALLQTFTRVTEQKPTGQGVTEKDLIDHFKLSWMERAYEVRGHLICDLDPLGMYAADLDFSVPDELEPKFFGFTEADLDREFQLGVLPKLGGIHSQQQRMKLRDIVTKLRNLYCQKIGWEYMHIVDGSKTKWLRERICNETPLTPQERKDALKDLARAEGFEQFCHKKYATTKRFGLDGGEALIAMLNKIIDHAANNGVETVVIGMAHRGRLNVLAHICGKDMSKIFCEFEGKALDAEEQVCGDVKYHLGVSLNRITRSGKRVRVSLLANPSHLESVNPVVSGKVRAKQHYIKDHERRKVMAILLHGDAAFSGQGVCYETMGLSDLEFYEIGGTVHIVVNNQIGFTTPPQQSRSAPYCTELAKPVQAPVFHVNGDDADGVVRVSSIAVDYRNEFKRDVVIDLVCYRRYGHNETDEPSFTQPLMYQKIRQHPSVFTTYSRKLVAEGVVTSAEVDAVSESVEELLRSKFEAAKAITSSIQDWAENEWESEYKSPLQIASLKNTGVNKEFLQDIGKRITTLPEAFEPHPTLRRIIAERGKNYAKGDNIDWGSAEALAFGSLLLEGNHVRVSGQDVERGTFSQRHALLVDVNNASAYIPLSKLHPTQAGFRIINSSLSEFGVCGYELGYAMENPASLVIWEAQFGDFCNGAQVIFDQYLCSMESKWVKQVGLVINLPHGYDGMGPEHSSGRIERFLQASDDPEEVNLDMINQARGKSPSDLDKINEANIKKLNWQVCYPSTPANYFHLLRRQIHRDFRKPLINFYSKAHLRAPNVSSLNEMSAGTCFQPVIDDPRFESVDRSGVTDVLLCSGQVYFTLVKAREKEGRENNLAIVRVEQVAPFPWAHVDSILSLYPEAKITWTQEEPQNMGSWSFVRPRLKAYVRDVRKDSKGLRYVGRPTSAATAAGNKALHDAEIAAFVGEAMGKGKQ